MDEGCRIEFDRESIASVTTMKSNPRWSNESRIYANVFLLSCAVIVGCFASLIPINKRINLGLDLKGGMHLVLKVQNDNLPTAAAREDAVLKSMEVLRNRIDGLGVGETLIQRQGDNQILLQLPGVTDREKALDMVGRVAHLEFHLVDPDESQLKDALAGHVPDGDQLMVDEKGRRLTDFDFQSSGYGRGRD